LLGHVMAESMPGAANIVGPVLPDQTRATVERFEIVAKGPEHQPRTGDPVVGGAVGFLVLAVDTQPSALARSTRIDEV
jgi:hypothetical protein